MPDQNIDPLFTRVFDTLHSDREEQNAMALLRQSAEEGAKCAQYANIYARALFEIAQLVQLPCSTVAAEPIRVIILKAFDETKEI